MSWNWLFNWIRILFIPKHKWSTAPVTGRPYILDKKYKEVYDVREVNDKRLVLDIRLSWFEVLIGWLVGSSGIYFLFVLLNVLLYSFYGIIDINLVKYLGYEKGSAPLGATIFLTVFFSVIFIMIFPLSVLGAIYPFLRPKERLVIFDRENQTVTLPQRFWGQESVTIPFSELQEVAYTDYGATRGQVRLFALRPNDKQHIRIGKLDAERDSGTFHRYMRKDLPLPEGELLDPYRERDNARREQASKPTPKL